MANFRFVQQNKCVYHPTYHQKLLTTPSVDQNHVVLNVVLCTNYPSSKFCSNCTLSDPIETSKNPKNGQNGQFSTFCALFSFLPPGGQNPKKPIGHQHPCPNYPSSKFRANCTLSDHFGTSKTPKNS